MIIYKLHLKPQDYEAIVDLEVLVWSMDSTRGAVPPHMFQAVEHAGGCIIGAFDDEQLIGFAFGIPARKGDDLILWSHMAGVHPSYQGNGVGFDLKQIQRRWALANGYTLMGWTFDPLQRRNANFNLNRLGAIATQYHANFYGEMTDGINAGLQSDRLEIIWQLNSDHVAKLNSGYIAEHSSSKPECLVFVDESNQLHIHLPTTLTEPQYAIQIPYDITILKQENMPFAQAWQLAIRKAMQAAIAAGYAVVKLDIEEAVCWYMLSREGN